MSGEPLRIVDFDPSRREEMFALLRACLGEKETVRRNQDFWRWKHEESHFGPSMVLMGEENGDLVGLRVFLRWRWRSWPEGLHSAVRAVDTVTHPDHQRKGIFSRLTKAGLDLASREQAGFVFNTPNRNSMPGYLKMGWQHVGRLPMQVWLLRPSRFIVGIVRHQLGRGQQDPGDLHQHDAPDEGRSTSITELLKDEQSVGTLLARDAELRGPGLTTDRSVAFLRWRYSQHPYVRYHAEAVRYEGRLRGIAIWRHNRRFGLREVMLCDLLLDGDEASIVRALVQEVRHRAGGDYMIAHFGMASAHRRMLARCGFFVLPGQGMEFTVRSLGRDIRPDPLHLRNWSLCLGDLEIF